MKKCNSCVQGFNGKNGNGYQPCSCIREIKHGDTISYKGFIGEVVSVNSTTVEVLFGGDALHNCIEMYDINDKELIVQHTVSNPPTRR